MTTLYDQIEFKVFLVWKLDGEPQHPILVAIFDSSTKVHLDHGYRARRRVGTHPREQTRASESSQTMKLLVLAILVMFSCSVRRTAETHLGPGTVCGSMGNGTSAICVKDGKSYLCSSTDGCNESVQCVEMAPGSVR